jgi:predicted nucleic acid-binding protein
MSFNPGRAAIVVDASAAMALLDDQEPWVTLWRAWTVAGSVRLAPAHFQSEVGNGLLRGSGISVVEASIRVERLFASGVDVADRGLRGILEGIELADRHSLTLYDALYLHLAIDTSAELATLDRDLAEAAAAEGVPLSA